MRKKTRCSYLATLLLFVSGGTAFGDTPSHAYTVELGPGNEDLEKEAHAIPWTYHPEFRSIQMKDASHVDFSGRDLRCAQVHFELNALYGANFDNCQLDGSTFKETQLVKCSFQGASVRYCEMDIFSDNPELLNDFTGADITGSWLHALPAVSLEQTKNYQRKRLVGTEIRSVLAKTSFRDFDLWNVNFVLPIEGCDFSGARMHRMIIRDVFSKEQLYSTANYRDRDLSDLLFWGPRRRGEGGFTGWDFSDCHLAYFVGCDLTDARFDDSYFLKTRAVQVSVTGTGYEMRVKHFYSMAKLSDMGFDGCFVSESQLQQTVNWKRKDLRGLDLKNMPLDGWDFSGMDLTDADLSGSSLQRTNFTDARIDGIQLTDCTGLTVSQLLESKTHRSGSRRTILEYYFWNVDFTDRTEEEKEAQESLRRKYLRK
ncbi:MAG: pentapeptide repeat-containing protein [Pirellulaceae bacterium]